MKGESPAMKGESASDQDKGLWHFISNSAADKEDVPFFVLSSLCCPCILVGRNGQAAGSEEYLAYTVTAGAAHLWKLVGLAMLLFGWAFSQESFWIQALAYVLILFTHCVFVWAVYRSREDLAKRCGKDPEKCAALTTQALCCCGCTLAQESEWLTDAKKRAKASGTKVGAPAMQQMQQVQQQQMQQQMPQQQMQQQMQQLQPQQVLQQQQQQQQQQQLQQPYASPGVQPTPLGLPALGGQVAYMGGMPLPQALSGQRPSPQGLVPFQPSPAAARPPTPQLAPQVASPRQGAPAANIVGLGQSRGPVAPPSNSMAMPPLRPRG